MFDTRLIATTTLLDRLNERIQSGQAKFELIKKNKVMTIKDGMITYRVSMYPILSCPCGKKNNSYPYCDHILYLLSFVWKVPDCVIAYLDLLPIKKQYEELAKDKKYSEMKFRLDETLKKFLSDEECGICLDSLGNSHLFECYQCHKFVHNSCMESWIHAKIRNIKNNNEGHGLVVSVERGCIFCQKEMKTEKLPGDSYWFTG
jgi:hypothetical protein